MKQLVVFALLSVCSLPVFSQHQITKTGHIWFYSEAPLEVIEAHNYQVSSMLNTASGDIVFKLNMTGFQFKKALMQEHFNEKYVESEKYPESTFAGKITNVDKIDFSKDGTYTAEVEGKLTIHNVTQLVKTTGTIVVKAGKIYATSVFKIKLADYNISIPSAVKDNIAEQIDIHVDLSYEPRTK